MSDRDVLYYGALLHDIGKLIERAKLNAWKEKADHFVRSGQASQSYAHKRFSAAFVEHIAERLSFIPKAAASLALWHHRGDEQGKDDFDSINTKGVLLKLLRFADDAAASERIESLDLEPQKYYLARLLSPFASVETPSTNPAQSFRVPSYRYLETSPLSTDRKAAFPLHDLPADVGERNPYVPLAEEFIKETEHAEGADTFLALMEKYLHAVPAQTPVEFEGKKRLSVPDVNLYDHSRSVAAIAVCLFEEWKNGSWKGRDAEILSASTSSLPEPCLLVSGDFSGIQDFIFDIRTDEKVARALKGRSFMVQLLTEACVKRILEELNLPAANILYDGGGNFYLLVPRSAESRLKEVRRSITRAFQDEQLFLTIAWTSVSLAEFHHFAAKWKEVAEGVRREKQRKFQDLGTAAFAPFPQNRVDDQHFDDLTRLLHESSGYRLEGYEGSPGSGWERIIHKVGYTVQFTDDRSARGHVRLNSTDLSGGASGFRFGVTRLPIKNHTVVTFQDLAAEAKAATGTNKIGVLKMDVDNLGRIFSEGLKDLGTISRIASISRSLKWFFEGYLNALLDEPAFKDKVYVVFAGGDDLFAVGPWNVMFSFASRVREEFSAFVGGHPGIHLSASLLVLDERFPVAQFAPMADEQLHAAKSNTRAGDSATATGVPEDAEKNSVSVFGTSLFWNEYQEAKELSGILVDMVRRQNESRAVIQKTQMMVDDFSNVERAASSGRFPLQRLWRLAYSFRDVGRRRSQESTQRDASKASAGAIIRKFEQMAFEMMAGKRPHLGVIAVAARWAELETRA